MNEHPGRGLPARFQFASCVACAWLAAGSAVCQESRLPEAARPGREWALAPKPEAIGWSSAGLEAAARSAAEIGTHSVMVVAGSGDVIWEWGRVDQPLPAMSVRKSLVSALFGIYAARGLVRLDATLAELGIDDVGGLTAEERQARVVDLLASSSGVYHPAAYETPGMQANRPSRGAFRPGEHWFYNNWDFNVLDTILEQAAGVDVGTAVARELAAPLGMQDFEPDLHVERVTEPVSIHPAVELTLSARDLARFGLLYLRHGRWGARQVVPEDWVAESTRVHQEIGIFGGYGLSWWVASRGEHFPFLKLPDGTYSARGTGEQVVLVLPHLDAVIVHRTRVTSPNQELMHVTTWARLLQKILAARTGS